MSAASPTRPAEERGQVTARPREEQERAADLETRDRVVDLRLRAESLGVGNVDDGRQPRLVACDRLLLGRSRRRELGGGLPGDVAGAIE
jgi:hypothetical protein